MDAGKIWDFLNVYPKWVVILVFLLIFLIGGILVYFREDPPQKVNIDFSNRYKALVQQMAHQYDIYDRQYQDLLREAIYNNEGTDAERERRRNAWMVKGQGYQSDMLRYYNMNLRGEALFLYEESCKILSNCVEFEKSTLQHPTNAIGYQEALEIIAKKQRQIEAKGP